MPRYIPHTSQKIPRYEFLLTSPSPTSSCTLGRKQIVVQSNALWNNSMNSFTAGQRFCGKTLTNIHHYLQICGNNVQSIHPSQLFIEDQSEYSCHFSGVIKNIQLKSNTFLFFRPISKGAPHASVVVNAIMHCEKQHC